MKRIPFIAIFLTAQLVMVVLHLNKQSKSIELSYLKQKKELEKDLLVRQKQSKTHELYSVHDPAAVKQCVQKDPFNLKQLTLSQIKRLPHD
jgi:hypothetical protein